MYEKILFPFWLFPKLNSAVRFSHTLHLSRLKNPFPSCSCLIHCVLQHLEVLVAILWACSSLSKSMSLLYWRSPGWTKHSRWGLLSVKQMNSNSLFSCWLCYCSHTQYEISCQYCRRAPHTQLVFHQDFRSFCQSCHLANNFCMRWSCSRYRTLHFCFGISWDFCYSSQLVKSCHKSLSEWQSCPSRHQPIRSCLSLHK